MVHSDNRGEMMNKTISALMALAFGLFSLNATAASDKDEIVEALNKQLHNLSCAKWAGEPTEAIVIRRYPNESIGSAYEALSETGLIKKQGIEGSPPEKAVFWVHQKQVSPKEFVDDTSKGEVVAYSISPEGKPLYDIRCKGLSLGKIKVQSFFGLTPPTPSQDGKGAVSFARLQIGFTPDKPEYLKAWQKFSGVKDGAVVLMEVKKVNGAWGVARYEVVN